MHAQNNGFRLIDIGLYWRTIKHLKQKQIRNRLSRIIKGQLKFNASYPLNDAVPGLNLQAYPRPQITWTSNNTFNFLNKQKPFLTEIDWNFGENGKLWTYHLNYLECLIQADIQKQDARQLLQTYIDAYPTCKDGKEPYPTSLRIIHVVKCVSLFKLQNIEIDQWIGVQALILKQNLEYHLLANHILENGFALLFASFHLRDKEMYNWAYEILVPELEEQILEDGAHFELSPSYHVLILSRILDSINLISNNNSFDDNLLSLLATKAEMMISWMDQMTVNHSLPNLNDSILCNAAQLDSLHAYALDLGISPQKIPLSASGYRKISTSSYDLFFDVGQIGAAYNPGHAHADSLQVLLWVNQKAVLRDTGISTYEKCEQRLLERSTSAHNTIVVGNSNSSEVWSSFRVGRRAKITQLEESECGICASHDGFKHLGVRHQRKIKYSTNDIEISDIIDPPSDLPCYGSFHFDTRFTPVLRENKIYTPECTFTFTHADKIEFKEYLLAEGFNRQKKSIKAIVHFRKQLYTEINVHSTL